MAGVVHIAGPDIQVGAQLRQRCAWCGAMLLDYALDRIAVPEGQNPRPATWPVGDLVEVDGPASWVVPHKDGQQLPANACAQTQSSDGRCRCGKPVNEDSQGCAWHEARHVAELTAALKRIDWQVGREQGSQWLAGELIHQGIRVQLAAEVTV